MMRSRWCRSRPTWGRYARTSVRGEDRIAGRHLVRELLGPVVDDLVCAELAHVGMVRGARGGDDTRPDVLRELDRKTPDAARTALDQDRLATRQLECVLDRN